VVPWVGPATRKVLTFRSRIGKLFGESLNHQLGRVEAVAFVSKRNAKYPVHMMRSPPWLHHNSYGPEPLFVRVSRCFRTAVSERRSIRQRQHRSQQNENGCRHDPCCPMLPQFSPGDFPEMLLGFRERTMQRWKKSLAVAPVFCTDDQPC